MGVLILNSTSDATINQFDPVITMEHATAVAPLSISFNVLDESTYGYENLAMLAEFMWDFGDDGTSNGTGTDDPYNIGKGYCPTHVYKEAGTYTITMKAYLYGELKTTLTKTVTIESIDDQVDWTTYYVSADGLDTNDGLTESTPFLTPKYAIDTYATTNTRFLLRNGDTFSKDDTISFGSFDEEDYVQGPILITSYEDASNPSDVKPIIYDSRTDAWYSNMFTLYGCDDIRFYDLKLQPTGEDWDNRTYTSATKGIGHSGSYEADHILLLDIDFQGTGSIAIMFDGSYNVAQGCNIRDAGSYGVFSLVTYNCAFIGLSIQDFTNDSAEYTMRLTGHVVQTYIAYCDLRADYVNNDLQIRGDDSSWNYVWNNSFDRVVGMNPTNDEEDQWLHHNTFDANIISARDYSENLVRTSVTAWNTTGFYYCSSYSMFRNNIAYGFLSSYKFGENEITGGCVTGWLHNNTAITIQSGPFVSVIDSSRNMNLKNNIYCNTNAVDGSSSDRYISTSWVGQFPLHGKANIFNSDYNMLYNGVWDEDETTQDIVKVSYGSSYTLPEWQADTSNDTHTIYGEATLNTTMDLDDVDGSLDAGLGTLNDGSSAIGSADPIVYTLFDFNNNERASLDIGAICSEVI